MKRVLLITLFFVLSICILDANAHEKQEQAGLGIKVHLYQQSDHWSPRPYYNEKNHNFFGVTIDNWIFAKFTNSFYEDSLLFGRAYEYKILPYVNVNYSIVWVHGYSDAMNMVIPIAGVSFGGDLGPQFEINAIPGAFTYGLSFKF